MKKIHLRPFKTLVSTLHKYLWMSVVDLRPSLYELFFVLFFCDKNVMENIKKKNLEM